MVTARTAPAHVETVRAMLRQDFERLGRDTTLTTLGFAIALGWSLFQVASGLGYLITTALQRFDNVGDGLVGGLTWGIGNRILAFGPLLQGLIEFGAVLAVFLIVARSSRRS
jgi:hypothetical protein